jgi:predicted O-methyltransferase YrrM
MTSLDDPAVRATLDRLHARARSQQRRGWGLGLGLGRRLRWLRGAPTMEAIAEQGRTACLSISPVQGQFLYGLARLLGARTVVEFGTSLGVSTIYLAAGVRDNGGGEVIGTELLAEKAESARGSLQAAGLLGLVDVRVGDARATLAELPAKIDLLFLDGDKGAYREVLAVVAPRLRGGGVVVADNIFTFPEQLRPYTRQMRQDPDFWTMTLPFEGGMELSVRLTG